MPNQTDQPLLSSRFDDALVYAAEKHRTQLRKGTSIPYLSHPLAVASLVLEHGGNEDEAIAGLLHESWTARRAAAATARVIAVHEMCSPAQAVGLLRADDLVQSFDDLRELFR